MQTGRISKTDLRSLPGPGDKYKLGLKIGGGVGGEVFEAVAVEAGQKVAVKVVELKKETEAEIKLEYSVLKELSKNENFPKFHDIYLQKGRDVQKIWMVMELCEGGTARDLARKLEHQNKKMRESHIAYIMRETIKAVIHLHENEISHRDIRGSNVLLTADGKVKLVDFGISKCVERNEKMRTCVGSPGWLAPEVIACRSEGNAGYDKKADVWALGITAIELGDGQAPYEDTHPGRALFQTVQNPPPTLRKPSDWSQIYNDFISECLVKNPENRPFAQELLQHTFFELIDEDETLLSDIETVIQSQKDINLYAKPEIQVRKGHMKIEQQHALEKILQEDLALLTEVSEDSVLSELYERFKKNEFQTFIGDILLFLNPSKNLDIYGEKYHEKYRFKGKSQNGPHIYSIAESAYRDVFHHEKPQHILFAGETGAGKTINMIHATDHLLHLGQGLKSSEKVKKALNIIHALGNAATPHNTNSTRHVLQTQLTFTDTGKVSGAVFRMYQLEKGRVTEPTKKQSNFHVFYYFYDAMKSEKNLREFHLNDENRYEYLPLDTRRDVTKENIGRYHTFVDNLREFEFEREEINSIQNILSAVILIGEIKFVDDEDGNGVLTTPEVVSSIADLLGVDKKKLSWALLNYCVILKGQAAMRHNSKEEAEDAKNALARGIYSRLVDWIINKINEKLSVSRVIYGDKHVISLLDFYGFECYKKNTLNQLLVNAINEQLHFYYNQRIFTWDKQIAAEEGEIPFPDLDIKDNKTVVDLIMSKPDGLLHKIDEATRSETSSDIIESLRISDEGPIFAETSREFSINHYTGKLTYDARDMAKKNQDFLPPEVIDTMRLSTQEVTKQLFSSLLSKSGNLSTQPNLHGKRADDDKVNEKNKNDNLQIVNTTPRGQYSQSRQMRTVASIFRSSCIDILKNLTVREFGFHFVRCIRTDLSNKPGGFDPEVVRQQLRALAVVNTILTTQHGYSYSVSHKEFIRRYKFLAFDFDENVEETKENCRLLLLRLKLEGWTMGKTKVFLKYHNKEHLSRLYETQIKKIVKVQSMMRAFMTRRKLYAKIRRYQADADKNRTTSEDGGDRVKEWQAAAIIQKKYREYVTKYKCDLTEVQKAFIKPWFKRWKVKSIFQVLLLYRAERLQTLVNFSLQIHIYNENAVGNLLKINENINLKELIANIEAEEYLPPPKPRNSKFLFMWDSLNLRGNVTNCEPLPDCNTELLYSEVKNYLNKRNPTGENLGEETSENVPGNGIQTSQGKIIQNEGHDSGQREDANVISQSEEDNDLSRNMTRQIEETNNCSSQNTINQAEELNINSQNAMNQPQELNNNKIQNALEADENANVGDLTNNETKKSQYEIAESLTRDEQNVSKQEHHEEKAENSTLSLKLESNRKTQMLPEQKYMTSIHELKEKFRNTEVDETGEDSPFNFRALLRKTNYPTGPKISSQDAFLESDKHNSLLEIRQSRSVKKCRLSDTIVAEIAPGILIHGKITNL